MYHVAKRNLCCSHAGLLGSARFTGSSQNYSTLLLEEEAGLLYVGGRGALYALNTSDISTPANLAVSPCHRRRREKLISH